jgi:DNA-binding beta-propeller fold protein YncE
MKINNPRPLYLCLMLWPVLFATALGSTGYHIIEKIPLGGGEETWDFATVDESARRLYLTHETEVKVLNADTGKPIALIPDLKGAHGVAIAQEFKRGFISNGMNATVTMFDITTFKKISDLPAGNLPDAIVYDPATKRVFSFNTVSRNSTVINAAEDPNDTIPTGVSLRNARYHDPDQTIPQDLIPSTPTVQHR